MTSLTPYRTPAIREVDPPPTMWPVSKMYMYGMYDVHLWIELATGYYVVPVMVFGALSSLILALLAVCGIMDAIWIVSRHIVHYARAWAEKHRVAREKSIRVHYFGCVGSKLVVKMLDEDAEGSGVAESSRR